MNAAELIKPYFIENRIRILIGLLCLITVDILQLFIPRIIKRVVDDLTAFQIDGRQLLIYALYMIAIAACIGVFRYVWRRCLLGTSRRVEEGLRNRLFTHLQGLSAAYFDDVKTGDLMAHATNDIQQIRMVRIDGGDPVRAHRVRRGRTHVHPSRPRSRHARGPASFSPGPASQ